MQKKLSPSRFTSDAHFVGGTILFFAFGEQLLQRLLVHSEYLASDLFYLPSIILSGLVALGLFVVFFGLAQLIHRLRPDFVPPAAIAAIALSLTIYLFAAAFPSLPIGAISRAYGERIQGQILSLACVAWTVALLANQGLKLVFSRSASAPRWFGKRGFLVVGLGLVVAALTHRPLFDSYATLTLVMLWALALPSILGLGLYRKFLTLSETAIHRWARGYFFLGAAVAAVSIALHYVSDARGGWIFVTFVLGATAAAYFGLARSGMHLGPALAALLGLLLFFLLPVLQIAWLLRSTGEPEPGQHVILITVDTLRRDALSAYNPQTAPTPNIDALLHDGAMFTNAWSSASWTLPSLVSIQTGTPPPVHQVHTVYNRLSSEWETLAEKFQKRGYVTEAIVYNPLLIPERGLSRGFDRYLFLPDFGKVGNLGQRLAQRIWLERFDPSGSVGGMTELMLRRLLRNRKKHFFVWLHLFDPHPLYLPPERFWPEDIPYGRNLTPRGRYANPPLENQEGAKALYLAEVQYVDESIGKFRETLQTAGLYDQSAIIFTSDHGEEFWEKGRWGHGNPPTDTQVRVPLMIKPPGASVGATIDRLTSTFEIREMLIDILDGAPPDDTGRVRSPMEYLSGKPHSPDMPEGYYTTSFTSDTRHCEAIIFGNAPHKYVYDQITDTEQLFDIGADPAELHSLELDEPELLERGRRLYKEHLEYGARESARVQAEPDIELPDEILKELKAHGYLE